ncbi:DNA polymerase III, beta subunit [Thermodesulfatator indicus DSM 15286]|uniref:Beta sliding clamp n=1 Tax=Thermodesulfatator indicus (strain DSM 15286 / JCM 11887 / CIR29812) TaxID=667014 RepID=F8ADK1_THEID|nr:DNA polymerase III subunit beta [Thermodesulfatator indicus]AEH44875.1 DNA polymerase III, beta subunit [Thermodesulfatator indicus DSM 15286]
MKLIVEKESLLKVLSKVQGIADRKSSMAILSTILFKVLDSGIEISATDLELGFKSYVEAEVETPGALAVPARKFYEIVKDFPQERLILEEEGHYLNITSPGDDDVFFRLACLPAEDFPALPVTEEAGLIEIAGDLLAEMITKTIFCVATEETRFILSGIYMEQPEGEDVLRLVATDGHRLAMIDRQIENISSLNLNPGIIVPKKAAQEIKKLAQDIPILQFGLKDNHLIIAAPNMVLTARLIDGQYPDYRAVIPDVQENPVILPRQKLLEALKRTSIISAERYRPVAFHLNPGYLTLVAQHPDLGEAREKIPINYEGEEVALNFNAKYLIDALEAMNSEEVEFYLKDEDTPCIIKGPEDFGFLCLVMPMSSV